MSDSSLWTPLRINAISSTPISSKRAITNIQSYLESSQARSGGDSAIRTRLDKLSSALKAEKHTSKEVCAHWRGQIHASSSYSYVVELRSGRAIRQEGGSLQFERQFIPFIQECRSYSSCASPKHAQQMDTACRRDALHHPIVWSA